MLAPACNGIDDDCRIMIDMEDLPFSKCNALEGVVAIELYHSALYLRQQVLSFKSTLRATPTLEDLSHSGSTVLVVL